MSTATAAGTVAIYTMCLVVDGERVLLMNRPNEKGFPGYIAPGGKLEMPESPSEGAIREVQEETGLLACDLVYKGLAGFVDPKRGFRYMVFNYVASRYEGELLDNPPEGELRWVTMSEAMELPMQSWFRERLPLFLEEGTFEIHSVWDEEEQLTLGKSIKKL